MLWIQPWLACAIYSLWLSLWIWGILSKKNNDFFLISWNNYGRKSPFPWESYLSALMPNLLKGKKDDFCHSSHSPCNWWWLLFKSEMAGPFKLREASSWEICITLFQCFSVSSFLSLLSLFLGDNSGWADIFDRKFKKGEQPDLHNNGCCKLPVQWYAYWYTHALFCDLNVIILWGKGNFYYLICMERAVITNTWEIIVRPDIFMNRKWWTQLYAVHSV